MVYIFGYLPLVSFNDVPEDVRGTFKSLNGDEVEETTSRMTKIVERASNNARVYGSAWLMNDGKLEVALVVERARDLLNHMEEWTEGEREKWFQFHWSQNGDEYALALVPDHEKSIERMKINFQLRTGYPMPKTEKVQIIFQPFFLGSTRPNFELNQETIRVHFIEKKLIERGLSAELESELQTVGDLKIVRDGAFTKDAFDMKN